MFKGLKIGAVAALVVALTACSGGGVGEQPNNEPAGVANVQPSETAEPLVAETPALAPAVDEAAYLEDVRDRFTSATQIPNATDEQLLDAAWEACAYLEAGGNPDDLTVIEGETRNIEGGYYMDSQAIAMAALSNICPELRD